MEAGLVAGAKELARGIGGAALEARSAVRVALADGVGAGADGEVPAQAAPVVHLCAGADLAARRKGTGHAGLAASWVWGATELL